MGRYITCCKDCTPPKRTNNCHDSCPEYLEQKAAYQQVVRALQQEKDNHNAVMSVRMDKNTKYKQMLHKRGRK